MFKTSSRVFGFQLTAGFCLALAFTITERFFNFTPHFPAVIQRGTSPDFMGNRQAGGLGADSLPRGRHQSLYYCIGECGPGKTSKITQAIKCVLPKRIESGVITAIPLTK